MKTRRMLLGLLLVFVMTETSIAAGRAKGTFSFNGKVISFEIVGENSASASGSSKNNVATVKADVDGKMHRIDITAEKLTWNKQSFVLEDYNKIEIFISNDKSSIKVDGKEILPKKKK